MRSNFTPHRCVTALYQVTYEGDKRSRQKTTIKFFKL